MMKHISGLLLGLIVVLAMLGPQTAFGQGMTEEHKGALETAGVPIYPGAIFLTSDESGHLVLWFSSPDEPDAIMDWYEENLPDWTASTLSGTRIIYKGPAGLEQAEILALPYVFVTSAERLGNAPDDDNEITVRLPGSP